MKVQLNKLDIQILTKLDLLTLKGGTDKDNDIVGEDYDVG